MSFENFLTQGWQDHATDAASVAARLADGCRLVTTAAQATQLAGLGLHVLGEHLGRFAEADRLLADLLASEFLDSRSLEARSIWRSRAVIARCAGDAARESEFAARGAEGATPSASERARMLSLSASTLLGQGRIEEATRDFKAAIAAADYGPSKDDPAARSLAVTGNNLACALEEKKTRTPAERELMLQAAVAARRFWEIAGNWMNVERAEYRLSAAHLAAGDAGAALKHARACLEICKASGADAMELFFARERLALAHAAAGDSAAARAERDHADACVDKIADEGSRKYCRGELEKLAFLRTTGA